MAKKVKKGRSPSPKKGNRPLLLLSCVLLAVGGGIAYQMIGSEWIDHIARYVAPRDLITLEARFTPEQIVSLHRATLLPDQKRLIQHTTLCYYPYLCFEVKYPDAHKTHEGLLLWGLTDGEMVLNTESWETTHGFRDCLDVSANTQDFRLLKTLAHHQGALPIDKLQEELRVDREVLTSWMESALKKHLVTLKGNMLHLHFDHPKFLVLPQTTILHKMVSKPLGEGEKKVGRLYGEGRILSLLKAAFGDELKVRRTQEFFLPVYHVEVLNPDGSLHATAWNALTGKEMPLAAPFPYK